MSWLLRAFPRLCRSGLQNATTTTIAPRHGVNMNIINPGQRSISTSTTRRSIQGAAAVAYDANNNIPPSTTTTTHQLQEENFDPNLQKQYTDFITQHPLLRSLRADPSFTETRPHLTMPSSLKPHHFIAGLLTGPGKLTIPPYLFTSRARREVVSVFHLGAQLCGHPGYVHGGLLTVLFDEVFARTALPYLPSRVGVTANLNVDYRAPAAPERWYVLRARTVGVEGRKAWVEGRLERLPEDAKGEGELVAEAKALFVEPKFAQVGIFDFIPGWILFCFS